MMNKIFTLFLILLLTLSSCEVTDYGCYTFEVMYEETYIPYRPTFYSVTRYDRCGLDQYTAYKEAQSNEYYYTWYNPVNGYYITERQTCLYWKNW